MDGKHRYSGFFLNYYAQIVPILVSFP